MVLRSYVLVDTSSIFSDGFYRKILVTDFVDMPNVVCLGLCYNGRICVYSCVRCDIEDVLGDDLIYKLVDGVPEEFLEYVNSEFFEIDLRKVLLSGVHRYVF